MILALAPARYKAITAFWIFEGSSKLSVCRSSLKPKSYDMFATEVQNSPALPLDGPRDNVNAIEPPPSHWKPLCHPRVEDVTKEVDGYFLEHWPFPNEKARKTFVNAGFSRVTCLYFPLSKDDRIHWACRLLTILFLIDDVLEDLSFADGEEYNNRLIPIMRGDVKPDRKRLPCCLTVL